MGIMEILLLIAVIALLVGGRYVTRHRRPPWLIISAAIVLLVLAWLLSGPGPIGPRIVVSAVALAMLVEGVGVLRERRRSV